MCGEIHRRGTCERPSVSTTQRGLHLKNMLTWNLRLSQYLSAGLPRSSKAFQNTSSPSRLHLCHHVRCSLSASTRSPHSSWTTRPLLKTSALVLMLSLQMELAAAWPDYCTRWRPSKRKRDMWETVMRRAKSRTMRGHDHWPSRSSSESHAGMSGWISQCENARKGVDGRCVLFEELRAIKIPNTRNQVLMYTSP